MSFYVYFWEVHKAHSEKLKKRRLKLYFPIFSLKEVY